MNISACVLDSVPIRSRRVKEGRFKRPHSQENKTMSTATQYTHQQVRDNFQAALKKIKTGILKNSPEDIAFIERLVTQHILANQLEPTEANFSGAFKALMQHLPWAVKPA